MANYNWPTITSTSGPLQILVNGVPEDVSFDSVNPENSVFIPVMQMPLEAVDMGYVAASGTNITTGAYVQVIASVADNAYEVSIGNSTGKTLILAAGAAASEVDLIYIPPTGIQGQSLLIKQGERLSLKCQTPGGATLGEVSINLFGKV